MKLPGVREPDHPYRVDKREVVFEGKVFRILREHIRLPNGKDAVHELIQHPGSVSVIPLLEEIPGRRELILVEQFRNSVGGYIHEIPAGMLEPREYPLDCARRELEEETGYVAGRWTPVTTLYPTPGIAGEKMFYFLAEDLKPAGKQKLDAGECLHVKRFPLAGLIESMVLGKRVDGIPPIVDGKTHIAVFYLAARYRDRGQ
jgi:ADP-ribose pyrophosphatase